MLRRIYRQRRRLLFGWFFTFLICIISVDAYNSAGFQVYTETLSSGTIGAFIFTTVFAICFTAPVLIIIALNRKHI